MHLYTNTNFTQLVAKIKHLGKDLGFSQIGITDPNLTSPTITSLKHWIETGMHADMHYFIRRFTTYQEPAHFMQGTTKIICCSLNYPDTISPSHPIAAFAHLQDYTKVMTKLLTTYAENLDHKFKILQNFKVSAGNAPVLEKALAVKAGLGWYGKNSLLLTQENGSYCFLGTIFTDIQLSLPSDQPCNINCNDCNKCITSCPTRAIVKPYVIDARRCISYLTIEHRGSIPNILRPLFGTQIFGCDICQKTCPCNKNISKLNFNFSTPTASTNYKASDLCTWFLWQEDEFQQYTHNLPIQRLGHERWLRNIAVALGNLPKTQEIIIALKLRLNHPSSLVREHVAWALAN